MLNARLAIRMEASLSDDIGAQLSAMMAGVSDRTFSRWCNSGTTPNASSEKKLRDIFYIVQFLQEHDSRHVVRAWLIGMNPGLDDMSPAEVIVAGDIKMAMTAARSFVTNG